MIGDFVSVALNAMWDIRDYSENKRVLGLGGNKVTLYCLVAEDLPIDTRNSYCKSLEIVYATIIRSMLSLRDRSRLDSSPREIFRSLPMLTPYDKVQFDKNIGSFIKVSDWFFNRQYNGSDALDVFNESFLNLMDSSVTVGMEADAFLKEGRGSVPTYVEINTSVSQLGGRPIEKSYSIGVEVRPKVVSNEELASMIIKRTKVVKDIPAESIWKKIKTKLNFNLKRKEVKEMDRDTHKSLNDLLGYVHAIEKPFICMLLSNRTRDILVQAGINPIDKQTLKKLYDTLPIMSISVYDVNTDTITASLTRDTYTVTRTAGEFNSEISNYEKQLSEIVRVNKVFG